MSDEKQLPRALPTRRRNEIECWGLIENYLDAAATHCHGPSDVNPYGAEPSEEKT